MLKRCQLHQGTQFLARRCWQVEDLNKELELAQANIQELQREKDSLLDDKHFLTTETDKLKAALDEW